MRETLSAGTIGTEPTVATHFRRLRSTESVGQSLVTYLRQKTKCRVPNTSKEPFCTAHIVFEDRFTWRASANNTGQITRLTRLARRRCSRKIKEVIESRVSGGRKLARNLLRLHRSAQRVGELVLKRRRKAALWKT